MRDLLEQIRIALKNDLYYIALFVALAIPDICGAIQSEDGEASKDKYVAWFEKYLALIYSKGHEDFMSGEDCYYLRCSLLHQGSLKHKRSKYDRIMFFEPSSWGVHNIVIKTKKETVLIIDVILFCQDIISATKQWLDENKDMGNYKKNYNRFMRRYAEGIPPYSKNIPTIT